MENPDGNEQMGMQYIHLNQSKQQNANPLNINHIRIIPMGPGIMNENPQNEIGDLIQIDNFNIEKIFEC